MKKNLYLDPTTYDLVLINHQLRFTSNLTEYVSQKIENTLKTFRGEWFLDYSIGIPYFDRILIKSADLNEVNSIFIIAIRSIPEITEIIEFTTDYDETIRKYSIDYKVRASEIVVEGEVTI